MSVPPAERVLTGWGRTAPSRALVAGPMSTQQLQELVAGRPPQGVLGRGAGRSYGDAAQNAGGYVLDPVTRPSIEIDAAAATARVSASVTFTELLAATVPRGLMLPALPGTRHVTVGGAIAADVHGKNQRSAGTIGAWVDQIELIDGNGNLRTLTPRCDALAFQATVGGMGLTGIMVGATIRLLRVPSAVIAVTSRRLNDLDALLAALDAATSQYAVAWIDTTASGASFGRGIIDTGDHLDRPHPELERDGLAYRAPRARRAPAVPFCPVTPWSARGFNTLWFRKAPRAHSGVCDLTTYFHRLDAIDGWNRAIGPGGIVQYQFAVPEGNEKIIVRALEAVQRHRCAPFLGTLKRFGPASGGTLSFPRPGWSLAIDMPARNPRLAAVLNDLDQDVASVGGRVYLAKDSRLSRRSLRVMYPVELWLAERAQLDPHGVFRSDLGRRLGLCAS